MASRVESRDRSLDSDRGSTDYGLEWAVDVSQNHVAIQRFQHRFYFLQWGGNGCHATVIRHGDLGHLASAGADDFQRLAKRQHVRRHQGGILTQTVPDDEIRLVTKLLHQAQHCHVGRQHGRLGDGGILQVFLTLRQGCLIPFHKYIAGQRSAQDGYHHGIGFLEGIRHDWFNLAQVAQHIDVLRSLPGKHEYHLARPTAAAEDALGSQGLPGAGGFRFQRLQSLFSPPQQFLSICKIDRQSFRALQFLRCRAAPFGQLTLSRLFHHGLQSLFQFHTAAGAQEEQPLIGFDFACNGCSGRAYFHLTGRLFLGRLSRCSRSPGSRQRLGHEINHFGQGVIVAQAQILAARDVVMRSYRGE